MRLIDSTTEEEYRQEMEEGAKYLLEDKRSEILMKLISREVEVVNSTYILSGYKLGSYQTCSILVNGDTVFHIQISDNETESVEKSSISEYRNGLKKQGQIKLKVALELAAKK